MNMNLRNRLLIPTLGIVTAGLALVGIVNYVQSRQALINSTAHEMQQACTSTLEHFSGWLDDQQVTLESWAALPAVQSAVGDITAANDARSAANEELACLAKRYGQFEQTFLLDISGAPIATSSTNSLSSSTIDFRQEQSFQVARDGKVGWSPARAGSDRNEPVMILSVPVNQNGKVAGVMMAIVRLSQYTHSFIDPIRVQNSGYVWLCNQSGEVLAHPDKSKILSFDIKQEDWGRELLQQSSGKLYFTFNGERKFCVFESNSRLGIWATASLSISELVAPARKLGFLTLGIGLAILAAMIVTVLVTVRSVTRPMDRNTASLSAISGEVAAAAGQVSSTSQSLADGATQQAAALQQTGASLEEMSSMIQRNADNARKANDLAREARNAADQGAQDMQRMNTAMDAIKASSDDIAKIIKTIDEIAFQTNILALNAAVEAARAGQAGMGFAVVADEVRNLAQRSAEAARETAAKIEGAIDRTGQGVEISTKVGETLNGIVAKARQVSELVAEVADASREQTLGITQINAAVGQLDRLTQANAASAEESASASEELSAHAQSMTSAVSELMELINHQSTKTPKVPASAPEPRAKPLLTALPIHSRPAPADTSDDLIRWDPARMSTGVEEIDEQHRELISMINQLHRACASGTGKAELRRMMNFLGQYVQTHFRHEEGLMEEHRCPSAQKNKLAHQAFLKNFEKLVADFETKGESTMVLLDLRRLVGDWLVNHICSIDTKLNGCTKSCARPQIAAKS